MAFNIVEMHTQTVPFSANGQFLLQLGPKPYTVTRIVLMVQLNVSTGTAPGTVSDPWDRVIANLNLQSAGFYYFNFSDMRLARHIGRMEGYQVRAPGGLGASVTGATVTYGYNIHFGVSPTIVTLTDGVPKDNPWDLTGGIPPKDQTLMLQGTWGPATAPGSGYTINSGTLSIILYGVQPTVDDNPVNFMPKAKPRFYTTILSESGAVSAFGKTYNVEIGDYLYSTLIMTTAGTNDDRTLNVFNSFEANVVPLSIWFMRFPNDDAFALASQLTQFGEDGWPPADDPASPGTLNVGKAVDDGLYYINWRAVGRSGHPLYGFDLRQSQIGDLIFKYGVTGAGNIRILHKKYVPLV